VVLYVVYDPAAAPTNGDRKGRIVGVARCVARGGMRGAWERWDRERRKPGAGVEDVGRVCETVNIVGDALWKMGSQPELPVIDISQPKRRLFPPSDGLAAAPNENGAVKQATSAIQDLQVNEPIEPQLTDSTKASTPPPLTTQEIDDLLNLALYQSLQAIPQASLPISGSTLYSAHVLPNRPAGAVPRERREDVVIAKSSWKKVGKWFKAMSDGKGGTGLIKIKEDKNGGCMVLSISANHDLLQSHRPHKTVAQEAAKEAAQAAAVNVASDGNAGGSEAAGKELVIEEFWKPSEMGSTSGKLAA